jgi:hypothetical protein
MGELNASAIGLAIILALAGALSFLRYEEETNEASGDRGKHPGNRRGGLR